MNKASERRMKQHTFAYTN